MDEMKWDGVQWDGMGSTGWQASSETYAFIHAWINRRIVEVDVYPHHPSIHRCETRTIVCPHTRQPNLQYEIPLATSALVDESMCAWIHTTRNHSLQRHVCV